MKSFYYLLFFLFTFSLFAKTQQPSINQVEIYVWGSILFSISMGSMLLIIHLIPRDKIQSQKSPSPEEKENGNIDTAPTEIPTTSISDSFPKLNTVEPSREPIKKSLSVPDSSSACRYLHFDSVFKMRLLDVENICKEFIDKLYSVNIQSISLYFIKNGRFVCYLEKKNNIYTEYNSQNEKADLLENVLSLLNKKLGAFSASHSDAVLPLVWGEELFGAIKLHYKKPGKNTEISSTWKEIKVFSQSFYSIYFKFGEIAMEEESEDESSNDSFQNILSSTFKSRVLQGLCLVKWIKGTNSELFYSQLTRKLNKFTKSQNKIYQLNDNMYGFILSDTSLELVQDNIGIFMGELILDDPLLEFCIGCSTNSPLHASYNDWYKSALQSLKNAVSLGPNKFNFMN